MLEARRDLLDRAKWLQKSSPGSGESRALRAAPRACRKSETGPVMTEERCYTSISNLVGCAEWTAMLLTDFNKYICSQIERIDMRTSYLSGIHSLLCFLKKPSS